ncbi:unnamed protein product [Lactuca virosa]|uniref:Uncharacterized protein n=1 Tax=Lactuca virosa TaxID=75947 RepID=A0AAU9PL71_9ASTR|nr:unnamed protein product [Lactuca virosa]
MPYPFSTPIEAEIPIIFGEWWNLPVEGIETEMNQYGNGPNSSDANTINGLHGSLYPCSIKGIENAKIVGWISEMHFTNTTTTTFFSCFIKSMGCIEAWILGKRYHVETEA